MGLGPAQLSTDSTDDCVFGWSVFVLHGFNDHWCHVSSACLRHKQGLDNMKSWTVKTHYTWFKNKRGTSDGYTFDTHQHVPCIHQYVSQLNEHLTQSLQEEDAVRLRTALEGGHCDSEVAICRVVAYPIAVRVPSSKAQVQNTGNWYLEWDNSDCTHGISWPVSNRGTSG